MAPQDDDAGESKITENFSVHELREWLMGRVADENDIVIDELQEDFFEVLEAEDDASGIKGVKEWSDNVTAIAEYHGKPSSLGPEWEFDGFRRCRCNARRDQGGVIMGEGTLLYENKDTFQGIFKNGIMNREGVLTRAEQHGTRIEGEWVNGLLQGEIRETLTNTGWIEGYYKDGVPHGFYREFGPRYAGINILRGMGRYYRGVLRGWCWKGMFENSGWLVGCVDNEGELTGDNIAYIYPDFKMAIKGKFEEGLLVEGHQCELIGSYEDHGVEIPVFSETFGPSYQYEKPSIKNIALNPLLRDPFEDTKVEVKVSNLPQGGEGLFAKKDIEKREIVALYNGIKVKTSTYAADHMPRSDYRIRLNADIDMDIPNGFEQTEKYCATLAHKTNHSFTPNCEWTLFESPRFGLIRSITAQKPIKAGEEILINYQMTLAKSPDWYRVIWLQHMRKVKRNDDGAIQRYIDRQYELQGYRIPLPDSEVLNVPQPVGVDFTKVPESFLTEEQQSEEAARRYALELAGIKAENEDEGDDNGGRFEEITEVD